MPRRLNDMKPMKPFELRFKILDGVTMDATDAKELVPHSKITNAWEVGEFIYDFFDGFVVSVSLDKRDSYHHYTLNAHDQDLFTIFEAQRTDYPNEYAGLDEGERWKLVRHELEGDGYPFQRSTEIIDHPDEPYFMLTDYDLPPRKIIATNGNFHVASIPAHSKFVGPSKREIPVQHLVCLHLGRESVPLLYIQPGRKQWALAKMEISLLRDLNEYIDGSAHYDGFDMEEIIAHYADYIMFKYPTVPVIFGSQIAEYNQAS